jgi:hypothetical protein
MVRHKPPLTIKQVLAWADAHHARTGAWPTRQSGPVLEAPGEAWKNLDAALHHGHRGLPAGGSLARLLNRLRGAQAWRVPASSWTAEEDELVRTLPAPEAAARTGRTLRAVITRRHLLGVRRPGRSGAEEG